MGLSPNAPYGVYQLSQLCNLVVLNGHSSVTGSRRQGCCRQCTRPAWCCTKWMLYSSVFFYDRPRPAGMLPITPVHETIMVLYLIVLLCNLVVVNCLLL
jgi:hypothetical protein